MIFNNIHLIGNSEDGRNMLLQLQQKAETWAESGAYARFSSPIILGRVLNRLTPMADGQVSAQWFLHRKSISRVPVAINSTLT